MSKDRENKKLVPAIRFKGFTDDWEQRKLGDIADFSKGSGFTKSNLTPKGQPIILYGRMYTQYETVINDVDTYVASGSNGVFSQGGEVLVPGSGETAEDISRASVVGRANILLGGDINIIEPKSELTPVFLALLISNGQQRTELIRRAQGKSIVHLHNSDLHKIILRIPTVDEQRQISSCILKVESTIALHQRKYENLQTVKKELLKRMFASDKKPVPDFRFKGFTNDWEQRKLSDLANFRRGSFPQPYGNKEWYGGENAMPFLQVVDVGQDLRLVLPTKQTISQMAISKSVFVPKGSVVVTLQGSIGRVAITQVDSYADRTLLIFESYKQPLDKTFWAYIIQQKFEIEKRRAPGGTIKTITKEALSCFLVSYPAITEQKLLGNLLTALDTTIALHQRKLEDLKKLKKVLLQKLFV